MPKKKGSFWARSAGNGLAHLQDTVDHICEWGFARMKIVGDTPAKKKLKNENKYIYKAKKAGRGVLSFFGTVGDSYYSKYEDLKREKEKIE